MTGGHFALIVEDDEAIADDLAEIVGAHDCDSRITDNKHDALVALRTNQFCFVLLDLQIKSEPGSIKGHVEHGNSLLREIRHLHADHPRQGYWLPVLVVSGHVEEIPTAVDVMKDGAADVIEKPFKTRDVWDRISRELQRSGRATHELCAQRPESRTGEAGAAIVIAIPGDRVRRRSRILVGGRSIELPDSSLKLLLRLMVAHEQGATVHKRDLGATDGQGCKGVSILRQALKPALAEGVDIIDNDYHGCYWLTGNVRVGDCDSARLAKSDDATITELAQELRRQLDAQRQKSEGNS